MASTQNILVWKEIKNAAPAILKADGNPGEILIKSRGKTLDEVKSMLQDYSAILRRSKNVG